MIIIGNTNHYQEVDLAAFPFILSTIRNKVVEHVGYYGYDRVGMLTR